MSEQKHPTQNSKKSVTISPEVPDRGDASAVKWSASKKVRVLILEPFYGGSHKQFLDTLMTLAVNYDQVLEGTLNGNGKRSVSPLPYKSLNKRPAFPAFEYSLYEMRAKKWHWRARTSALYFSQTVPPLKDGDFQLLFVSSVLPLAEIVALRPDIGRIGRKLIYFHENQLVYPVRAQKERDFQYGYNQILSCMVADTVVFNSNYNRDSFLLGIKPFLKIMPDYRPPDMDNFVRSIAGKSETLYYPIQFSHIPLMHDRTREKTVLHILGNARWEHDKNPESFFRILLRLKDDHVKFKVSVLGETFTDVPLIFQDAKERLKDEIVEWGFLPSKEEYYAAVSRCNVSLSTAIHEFFGVAMLESAYCGCYPLCPNRLVYPEIFPSAYLYQSEEDAVERLKAFAADPASIPMPLDVAYSNFDWTYIKDKYQSLLARP